MSTDPFTRYCESLDFPMTIVTAFDGRERSGCLVGFHTQCSIEPRRWLVCISKANHTFGVARRAEWLVVHLLRDDQHALAQLFGGVTEDAIAPHEKFERAPGVPGPAERRFSTAAIGSPDACSSASTAGDHVAHVLEITEVGQEHAPAPQFGSMSVRDITPGHASVRTKAQWT